MKHSSKSAKSATITLPELECLRCEHRWHPRKHTPPLLCPSCRSDRWNTPRVEFRERTCAGCGHKWTPRSKRPKRCRKCGQEVQYGKPAHTTAPTESEVVPA